MTLHARVASSPAHQNNVRLVVVDDRHQPTYLLRAQAVEKALLRAAEKLGLAGEDLLGLYGLCVEAVRSAESHGR